MKNKKIVILVAMAIVLIFIILCFRSCGKKNSYVGYYTMEGFYSCALCVNKDGTVTYSSNQMNWRCSTGYMEKEKDYAALYFNKHKNPEAYIEEYCPLFMTLSDDGKRMYLSSDNPDWATDTYDVVEKEDYDAFVEEHELITTLDD